MAVVGEVTLSSPLARPPGLDVIAQLIGELNAGDSGRRAFSLFLALALFALASLVAFTFSFIFSFTATSSSASSSAPSAASFTPVGPACLDVIDPWWSLLVSTRVTSSTCLLLLLFPSLCDLLGVVAELAVRLGAGPLVAHLPTRRLISICSSFSVLSSPFTISVLNRVGLEEGAAASPEAFKLH